MSQANNKVYYAPSTEGFYLCEIHGTNIPADAVEISSDYHQELLQQQAQGLIIQPDDTGYPVAVPPPAPTADALEAQFKAAIDARLDAFAKAKDYDDILSARLASDDYEADGQIARAAWSAAWKAAIAIWEQVTSGALTIEQALEQLPALEWPEKEE
jgi:hypothetical protein